MATITSLVGEAANLALKNFFNEIATMSTGFVGMMRIVNLEQPFMPNKRYFGTAQGSANFIQEFFNSLDSFIILALCEGTTISPTQEKVITTENSKSGIINYHWGTKSQNLSFKETTGMLVSRNPATQSLKIMSSNSIEEFLLQNATYYDLNNQIIYSGLNRLVVGSLSNLVVDYLLDKNYSTTENPSTFGPIQKLLNLFFVPEIEAYGLINGYEKTIDKNYSMTFNWEFMLKSIITYRRDLTNFTTAFG